MSPDLNAVRICAFGCGTTWTSPPPLVSVLNPCPLRYQRRAMSWVPLSCGSEIFLPLRSDALVIDLSTTRNAPPDVVPATTWAPPLVKELVAGPGPMNDASMAPLSRAVVAAGPALKTEGLSVTLLPRSLAKSPLWTPYTAGPWVTLG